MLTISSNDNREQYDNNDTVLTTQCNMCIENKRENGGNIKSHNNNVLMRGACFIIPHKYWQRQIIYEEHDGWQLLHCMLRFVYLYAESYNVYNYHVQVCYSRGELQGWITVYMSKIKINQSYSIEYG